MKFFDIMFETRMVPIKWTKPNFDFEHHEILYQLKNHKEHPFLPYWVEKRLSQLAAKTTWMKAQQAGKVKSLSLRDVRAAGNTGNRWLSVEPSSKKRRSKTLYSADKTVEMPIYLENPTTGELWLIGGHHRSTFVTQVLNRPISAFVIR
jgi:hypothetical protein